MKPIHALFVVILAASIFAPTPVRADCAAGATYAATVTSNEVFVYVDGDWNQTQPNAIFRQNEADGTVVTISGGAPNFYDECVPAGTYRYGYATPFDCNEGGCGGDVPYFTEATVTNPLPATCTRDANVPAPTATDTVPPWMNAAADGGVSEYKSCPHSGCSFNGQSRTGVRAMMFMMFGVGLLFMGRQLRRARAKVRS